MSDEPRLDADDFARREAEAGAYYHDAAACRKQLEAVAARLESLTGGHPAGRPWNAEYLMGELWRLAAECREVLGGD